MGLLMANVVVAPRLREALEPGETMPNVAILLKLVERRLCRARERLRERDGRLNRALTALNVARRLRDQAAEKMRGC